MPDTDITDTKRTITKKKTKTTTRRSTNHQNAVVLLWEPCPFCAIKNVYGTNGMDEDDRMNSATRQLFFVLFFSFTTFETCCFRFFTGCPTFFLKK